MNNKIKLAMILSVTGVVMIITGLIVQCVTLSNEKDNLYYEVVEKTDYIEELECEIYKLSDEIIQLRWENDALWDIYYSGVTEYTGEYEYYE